MLKSVLLRVLLISKERTSVAIISVLLVLILCPKPAEPAQMQMPAPNPQGQPPPAKLLPDMGGLHHPIGTKNPEAQQFFDQGLTLVYAFNFLEAYHSFQRAAELDPTEPMPHWGSALALGPNYNSDTTSALARAAYNEIQKAQTLVANAPQNERDYVNALAQLFSADPQASHAQLAANYAAAMHALSQKYPDDPDAQTLYAVSLMDLHPWHLWNATGQPLENTNEIVSVLEGVLKRWPNHIGANHFLIHALEASPYPDRALDSAKRLGTLAPGAGHLVHMPSHIFVHTGQYIEAVKSNEAAVEADRVYWRMRQIPNPAYVSYIEHNLYFLTFCAMMDGELQTAANAAKELAMRAQSETDASMADGFTAMQTEVLLRFARWQQILGSPLPPPKYPLAIFYGHFGRGMALAATGNAREAEGELHAMDEAEAQMTGGQFNMSEKGWNDVRQIADEVLSARIAEAQHDAAGAIAHLRKAVEIQDASEYAELPEWFYPVRESLGAELFRDGQLSEAEGVFRDDLKRNKLNPRSLFGLWKTLEAEKKSEEAQKTEVDFEAAWKSADSQLTLANY